MNANIDITSPGVSTVPTSVTAYNVADYEDNLMACSPEIYAQLQAFSRAQALYADLFGTCCHLEAKHDRIIALCKRAPKNSRRWRKWTNAENRVGDRFSTAIARFMDKAGL